MAQDGELGELEGDDVLTAFAGDLLAVVIVVSSLSVAFRWLVGCVHTLSEALPKPGEGVCGCRSFYY